jgi:hypothetical protein
MQCGILVKPDGFVRPDTPNAVTRALEWCEGFKKNWFVPFLIQCGILAKPEGDVEISTLLGEEEVVGGVLEDEVVEQRVEI